MGGLFPRNKTVQKICAVVLTIIVLTVIVPIILLTTVLLLLIRAALTWYKNRYKPELGEFLGRSNSIFAADDPYHNPTLNVCSYLAIDGHLTKEKLKDIYADALERFRKEGIYPELNQELTTWMGFSVWKKLDKVDLNNYGRYLDDEYLEGDDDVTDENACRICFKLTKVPFTKHTAPGDVWIYHSKKRKNKTVLFLRFHHSMGDALSMLQLFTKIFKTSEADIVEKFIDKVAKSVPKIQRTWWQKLWYVLSFPVVGVYEMMLLYVETWDLNEWLNPLTPTRTQFRYVNVLSKPTQEVKEIQARHGNVRFFSVTFSAFCAGLRKYMVRHGIQVPEDMSCVVSVPIPTKKVSLSNNLTFIVYKMPVSWNSRKAIIQCIEQQSVDVKTSRVPIVTMAAFAFLGLMPKMAPFKWIFSTAASSNVPGFENPLVFDEYRVTNMQAAAATCSSCGIYYWSSGFNQNLTLNLGVSTDIMKNDQELKELSSYIAQELEAMKDPTNDEIITKQFLSKCKSE